MGKLVFVSLIKIATFIIYCFLLTLEVPLRANKKTRKFAKRHLQTHNYTDGQLVLNKV